MFEKIRNFIQGRGKMEFRNPPLRIQHPEIATPDPIQPLRPYLQESRAGAMDKRQKIFNVSAYSPSSDETDDTPWIAARNFDLRPGTMAGKRYAAVPRVSPDSIEPIIPYGSTINIDGQPYEVRDMMNARFAGQDMIDLFMPDKRSAMEFGRRKLPVEY